MTATVRESTRGNGLGGERESGMSAQPLGAGSYGALAGEAGDRLEAGQRGG
ncbi:hypothetical protein ACRAWF_43360 [Streptomyces sp. L7]